MRIFGQSKTACKLVLTKLHESMADFDLKVTTKGDSLSAKDSRQAGADEIPGYKGSFDLKRPYPRQLFLNGIKFGIQARE
jgi:hypothetical protein